MGEGTIVRIGTLVGIAVLWIGSVVVAFLMGWALWGGPLFTLGDEIDLDAPDSPAPVEALDTEPDQEEDAYERLKQQLEEVSSERETLGRDYLQLALEYSLAKGGASPASRLEIETLWNTRLEALLQDSGGMFGGLEEMIALLVEMAAHGEPAIRFMTEVANDNRRSEKERRTALELMSHLRHPAAFDALLDFRDDAIMELDYPYDLVRCQVADLERTQLAHRIPEILGRLNADLGADNFSPERAEVLVLLALRHNEPQARSLLNDPRMWHENVQGAISTANALHTEDARRFLDALARNHTDSKSRKRAENLLANW